jgi:hypothetical protein
LEEMTAVDHTMKGKRFAGGFKGGARYRCSLGGRMNVCLSPTLRVR